MPTGAEIGGYRINRVIGSGAMGTVYAVDDPALPRLDALKVLSGHLSANPDFRARFLRESDIAATLDHPHIVSVYDRGETAEGQLWIAMQYVEGTDAEAAVRAGTMTAARAVHIITAIAEALDYAHRRGILHRDVKPANFLLAGTPGTRERVFLTDFGIAGNVDDTAATPAESAMTSFAYAAPEVVSGKSLGSSADVYSLGCALFELLTGTLPYSDTTKATAQALAHLSRPPPRVSERAPDLGSAFDQVIATAMHKQPDQRYRSGAELAAAATAALHSATAPSGADGPKSAPRKPLRPRSWTQTIVSAAQPGRRRRIAAVATVSVVIAAVAATVIVSTSDDNSTNQTQDAAPTSTAQTAAPIADTELAGLLPPVEKTAAVMGVPLRIPVQPLTDVSSDNLTPAKCAALVYPVQLEVYRNSGYTAAHARILEGTQSPASVVEAVVAFPSAGLATTFVARQSQLWPNCEYAVVKGATGNTFDTDWSINAVDTTDPGMLTAALTRSRPGDDPAACQRALTARNNIVIDIQACRTRTTITDQAVTLAKQIAAGIPGGP